MIRAQRGFALPTVLIAGTLMLIVLTSALVAATSIRAAVQQQYYDQVAREAAESGLVYAQDCLAKVAGSATTSQWTNNATVKLRTGDSCAGSSAPSASCTSASPPATCFVISSGRVKTRFEAEPIVLSGVTNVIRVTSYVDVYRSNGFKQESFSSTQALSASTSMDGIASGNDTTCAIQSGKLYCWGKNNYGQVGNGTTTTPVKTPTLVQGALTGKYVYAVATGVSHTCAIAGTTPGVTPPTTALLYCWGDNSMYQFGLGNTTSSTVPVLASSEASRYPVAISARDHTCSIRVSKTDSTNRVHVCWGYNVDGQAGENCTPAPTNPCLQQPYKMTAGYAVRQRASPYSYMSNVQKIANVSGGSSCGLNGSQAYCIGVNGRGQLGDGTVTGSNSRAKAVATNAAGTTPLTGISAIATNNSKACALSGGKVWCWGGNGSASDASTRDWRLDSGPNFSAASEHGYAKRISTSGITHTGTVTDFAMTDWNICQVVAGKVYCSGYNDKGQLGQGTTSGPAGGAATAASQVLSANNAVQVTGALASKTVVKIEGGNNHFCAITSDKKVYCWGFNNFSQLGDGTTTTRTIPTEVKMPPLRVF